MRSTAEMASRAAADIGAIEGMTPPSQFSSGTEGKSPGAASHA